MNLEKSELKEMLRKMIKIRYFEQEVSSLFAQAKIPGFVHLYIGMEAVAVGVCTALRKDDYITSTHRGHGHCIAKGARLDRMMAELFGKEDGYCKGKGGSLHIADFSVGMLGAQGIVGAGIPIAVGAGLSSKMRRTDQVTASFFGEGASNQGTFHEGINLAAIWKLPIIFVCENNLFASNTPQSKSMLLENVADRAVSYGIPGIVVDGNDVLSVYENTAKAVKRAREGKGPTLMECKTYRWRGHFEGDPARYRSKEELKNWMKKDPIKKFREKLFEMDMLTEKEDEQIKQDINNLVREAVEFGVKSLYPKPEEATKDVFFVGED